MSRPVEWFWKPFIPRGKVTILAGDSETGKSWLSLWIASCWSRGDAFPIGCGVPNGNLRTMILNAEDDPDDTIVPRLELMRAAKENIIILADEDDDAEGWDLDERGLLRLESLVEAFQPALLVLDSANVWFGVQGDMYRPNDVTAFMKGLKRIARRHRVAVVLIAHLSKGSRSTAMHSILGSVAFVSNARSILVTKRVSREKCILSQVKGSVVAESEKIRSMEYAITDLGFEWGEETDLTVDDLNEAESDGVAGKGGLSSLKSVEQWLDGLLGEADGPLPSSILIKEARACGIAERTLERAKKSLGCETWKEGKRWVTALKGEGAEGALLKGAQHD